MIPLPNLLLIVLATAKLELGKRCSLRKNIQSSTVSAISFCWLTKLTCPI